MGTQWCVPFWCPFLVTSPAAVYENFVAISLDSQRRARHFYRSCQFWRTIIFRVDLRTLDFIGSEHRRESTTWNIYELRISESIPVTEYFPFPEPNRICPSLSEPEFEGGVGGLFCVEFKPGLITLGAESTGKVR